MTKNFKYMLVTVVCHELLLNIVRYYPPTFGVDSTKTYTQFWGEIYFTFRQVYFTNDYIAYSTSNHTQSMYSYAKSNRVANWGKFTPYSFSSPSHLSEACSS